MGVCAPYPEDQNANSMSNCSLSSVSGRQGQAPGDCRKRHFFEFLANVAQDLTPPSRLAATDAKTEVGPRAEENLLGHAMSDDRKP